MNNQTHANEIINQHLKKHQIAEATDWSINNIGIHEIIKDLHKWSERFIFEFKLKLSSTPALMIQYLGRTRLGHFRPGRNSFGLKNEIAINQMHIFDCSDKNAYWEVLGTLFHELLHAEQEESGKPGKNNYHNKEFQDRAREFGLIVDSWGHTKYMPAPSPFFNVLDKYNIVTPTLSDPIPVKTSKGNSRLKPWICECDPPVHVRVAIADFQAQCLKCGGKFHLKQT